MNLPEDLKYSKSHEWVKLEGNIAIVGITDYAQSQLGDIVYVELPEIDSEHKQFNAIATIESVKSVSDIYAPLSGKVIQINENLEDEPELVNKSPYQDGWLFKLEIEDENEIKELLDVNDYKILIGQD